MILEFLAGLAVGAIVFGHIAHRRWEKRHDMCPYNPDNKKNEKCNSCKDSNC